MRFIKVIFIVFVIFFVGSLARAEWFRNGQPLTDATDTKTNGEFGAQLIFVADREKLFEAWDQPTVGVKISNVDRIARNKPISSFIVFSNAKQNKKGKANVTAKYFVTNPNGEIIQETKPVEVWKNRPAPKERALELSVDFLELVLDKSSPLGVYTVNVMVYDANANLKIELEKQFTLLDEE